MMPDQKPGKSRQDYCSPDNFIAAVVNRFGPIAVDLAAKDESVSRGKRFVSLKQDSLSVAVSWEELGQRHYENRNGCLYLNPPFADIAPWMRKAWSYGHGFHPDRLPLVMLVPASVGSNWFNQFVHGEALVLALNPRLTFKGETAAYPKDCLAIVWNYGVAAFDVWVWKS
jgi:hypothetical protein